MKSVPVIQLAFDPVRLKEDKNAIQQQLSYFSAKCVHRFRLVLSCIFRFAECLVSVVAKNKKYWRYFFNLLLCARIYRSHGSVRELNLELLCTIGGHKSVNR